MKIRNLILFLCLVITFASCVAGRVSIVPPSSQSVLNSITALKFSVDSFFAVPDQTYKSQSIGYSMIEQQIFIIKQNDSLRANHSVIINTDNILQKQFLQVENEHQAAREINSYKAMLYRKLIDQIINSRIVQEKSLLNVKI